MATQGSTALALPGAVVSAPPAAPTGIAKMDPRLRSFIEDKWRLVPGKRIISSPSAPMQPTYYQRWSSWLGASVMSSYSGFLPMWVSKQEYEEHGFGILMKRCP